jgi:hypothetical protein
VPPDAVPGTAIADADTATNRLLWRVQPTDLAKTVLVKDEAKQPAAAQGETSVPAADSPDVKDSAPTH